MRSDFDVVVAGGGFAGLAAVENAAMNGADSILFEKSSEIGYPIHTSGGSFIEDMEEMGISEEFYHPIQRVLFVSPTETAEFRYPTARFCVIDVRAVRQHLAERAIAAGASICTNTRVVDTLSTDGCINGVQISGLEDRQEVRAAVTIDGTGFNSVIGQSAGLHDGFDRFGRGLEYDVYAPDYDTQTAQLLVGNDLIPGGYGWIFPYSSDRVRIGVGSLFPDEEPNLREAIDKLFREYRDSGLEKSAQVERHAGIIPSNGTVDRTIGDGVLLTGDAANFPFGLVGEGIRMALDTGRVAGSVAAESVATGDVSKEALRPFEKYWRENYQFSLRVSNSINKRLASFDDETWDKGTRILAELDQDEFYRLLRSDFTLGTVSSLLRNHPTTLIPLWKELMRTGVKIYVPWYS